MDFIEGLPESNGCTTLLVVTDLLSKDVILIPLKNTTTETVAHNFLCYVVAYHWLPDAIVSDYGTQFTSHFWAILTKMMRITHRLSTAWHPQTDGSTERMNRTIEAYLRAYIEWAQSNWVNLLPLTSIAIKGRKARSTRVSPFFLQHGYNIDTIQLDVSQEPNREELEARVKSDYNKAKAIVEKFKQVFDIAQTTMAEAQQEQERQANRHRHELPTLQVNDKVWLSYRKQLFNGRSNKKLDWKNAKYTVTEVINSHSVRLNTPPGIHNVFYIDRLRLASSDPFPSQPNDDTQPAPVLVNGELESEVEQIMAEVTYQNRLFFEVKWTGYALTTFEPAENLQDNSALDEWEIFTAPYRNQQSKLLPAELRRGDEEQFSRRKPLHKNRRERVI
jgi:transposase InsO family protein